jgi:hypothetical protein
MNSTRELEHIFLKFAAGLLIAGVLLIILGLAIFGNDICFAGAMLCFGGLFFCGVSGMIYFTRKYF